MSYNFELKPWHFLYIKKSKINAQAHKVHTCTSFYRESGQKWSSEKEDLQVLRHVNMVLPAK